MLNRLSIWKYLAGRMTRKYGVIDPFELVARLRRFSQPSEIQEPLELLREGIKFHARGLINTRVIQHNMDWVWPYWVERQFSPGDVSFIPRAFSFSHINLTHRNWTAVGLPDLPVYPIIDPRGLVTPLHNSWSLDFWVISDNGDRLLPSKMQTVTQHQQQGNTLCVKTAAEFKDMQLVQDVRVNVNDRSGEPFVNITIQANAAGNAWVYCVLRPYNPEGIQFIEDIAFNSVGNYIDVNKEDRINLSEKPDKALFSDYARGDVIHHLNIGNGHNTSHCDIGLATAAFGYRLMPETMRCVELNVPLGEGSMAGTGHSTPGRVTTWQGALNDSATLELTDEKIKFLYDTAKTTLVLLSTDQEIVPGPFTYRRFWFRDACLMLNALMSIGMTHRCRSILNAFPRLQALTGYFHSQEGEWDSNGQVLWICNRYQKLSRSALDQTLVNAVVKGARWIEKKRIKEPGALHDGLLPAGFSAEHLGPNDYYFWDDFWSIAGLTSAAEIVEQNSNDILKSQFKSTAYHMEQAVMKSLQAAYQKREHKGFPASPYRRMDAGAIGSLVADYPLQIYEPGNPRIVHTMEFLMAECFYDNAFFQDMTHSGVNVYLTLAIAQTLLRMGDQRYEILIRRMADLATSTGHWPEAIHPATGGGCMGDGQHGWAAAEWLMMIRNLFVREEGDSLIMGSGIFKEWLEKGDAVYFGPAATPHGRIGMHIDAKTDAVVVSFDIEDTFSASAKGEIRVPGYRPVRIQDWQASYPLEERN